MSSLASFIPDSSPATRQDARGSLRSLLKEQENLGTSMGRFFLASFGPPPFEGRR